MSNKLYHDFILGKLNAVPRSDDSIFGGEFLWSYVNGELTVDVPNTGTLLLDKKPLIPFVITSYDGERLPLALTKIKKYTMPIVFAIQYGKKELWDGYIEAFADSINGKTFDVGGVNVGFGVSINTQTGAGIELKADDWINTTITVFAYEGNVFKGNDIIYKLNGAVVEPLSYTSSMQNETSFNTPNNVDYGKSRSNGKQHTRAYALLMTNSLADTWIKEIEGDVLNTNYAVNVAYPYGTVYNADRNMMLDKGTVNSANGTALLLELIFIDA